MLHLNSWLTDDAMVTLNYDEFARSLGTTPARLNKCVTRLVGFHLAHIDNEYPDTLHIKQRYPTLAAAYDEQLHTAD